MIASARAELLRLSKWSVTWVIIGVWLTLNVFFGYVLDYLSYRDAVGSGDRRVADALLSQLSPDGIATVMVGGLPMFGGALVLILAALATGSGYGWSTWRTVFTQGPGRLSALGGTMVALGVLLTVLAVLTMLVDLVASSAVMAALSEGLAWPALGTLAEGLGGAMLIIAMWAAAGALIGVVARSPGLAVGLGLVWLLVVENLLRAAAELLGPLEAVTEVLPGTAAGSLAGALGTPTAIEVGGAPGVLTVLTGTAAIGLLAAYVVAFLTSAALVVARRDA
jgi:ABC-2 type transport system permease protein